VATWTPPPAPDWTSRLQPETPPTPAAEGPSRVESALSGEETPPRGIPAAERGWFDEYPEDGEQPRFGPTGQPTELPYRYRP
ncbi:hypothetical protein FNH07_34225, partial [Amycolatopsis bartoniae]